VNAVWSLIVFCLAARSHKSIPEIFLTRLLSTKGTIQKFVDDFFGTILKVPPHFPPPVKWLFDLLDEAAAQHGLNSPEVSLFKETVSWVFFCNFDFVHQTSVMEWILQRILLEFLNLTKTKWRGIHMSWVKSTFWMKFFFGFRIRFDLALLDLDPLATKLVQLNFCLICSSSF
jgi:hypothetical protein